MGIAGVAPGARILGLRACWERPGHSSTICDSLSLAKALTYALEKRTKVINLSLSGLPDRLLSTLISRAISRGTIVIAALDPGNPRASFPASEKGVIAVADERLSSRDSHVYIAPGVGVPTTAPEGKWNAVDGSSYAAAHVSGLAALLREVSPRRSAISFLGSGGSIDACAAMARITALDERSCRR